MSTRRFATSVVVTLAALPSCASGGAGSGGGQPPVNPPSSTSRIEHRPDGTCWKIESASCPPNASCNPPPPMRINCATGEDLPLEEREGYPYATPPPRPQSGQTEPGYRIDHRADNTCWRVADIQCPPNTPCNPPAPVRVDCDTHQPLPQSEQ